jgi:hypothetical protein
MKIPQAVSDLGDFCVILGWPMSKHMYRSYPANGESSMKYLIILVLLVPALSGAQWSTDPAHPLPVAIQPEIEEGPITIADLEGGCFVIWVRRGASLDGTRIHAQHLNAEGYPSWSSEGLRVCTYDSKQTSPAAISDGSGGIIVVWRDEEIGTTDDANIFAQKLSPAGLVWIGGGLPVCAAADDQYSPSLASDGNGGCFVSWSDSRNAAPDIFAQHLNEAGDRQWGSAGLEVCDYTGFQGSSQIVPDQEGGTFVLWVDFRSSTEGRITGQHLAWNGDPLWTENGLGLSVVYGGFDTILREVIADGQGGFFFVKDLETSDGLEDFYVSSVSHRDQDGESLFFFSSEEIAPSLGNNGFASLAADGNGGVFAAAAYQGDSYGDKEVRVQHFASNGDRLWGSNGLSLRNGEYNQNSPRLGSDGEGGIVVAWYDSRSGDQCAYAQRINAAGLKLWPDEDILVSYNSWATSPRPTLLTDGGWVKALEQDYGNIHLARLGPYGYLDDPRPVITSVQDVPNDQGGEVTVHWNASWLDGFDQRQVEEYSVWMRSPDLKGALLSFEAAGDFAERQGWPESEVQAFNNAGWGYVTTVPALLEPSYFAFAPTFGDSTGAGIPYTEYRVVAHSDEVWISWECLSEYGYSVDNLEPGAPVTLAAVRVGDGTVDLSWEASGVHDEDLHSYLVYGGHASGFDLDEDHFIGSAAAPVFSHDPGVGIHFYRVTARDAHGNEGPGSNEAQAAAVSGVPDVVTARALHANWPNPFNPSTVIAFDLPKGQQARLTVFALDGTRVRTLVNEWREPGRHQVRWDGRDDRGNNVAAGVYFYSLRAGDFRDTKSMVLIK